MLVPVEHQISLKRETSSGAIVNEDVSAYESIRRQKQARLNRDNQISQELSELRELVRLLADKVKE